ncbi:hypothetical protein [Ruminococcus sp.]|uniref:hypothetical protein n=1 Tax=Ruminococcus sp. TaxID=41978 RepID=UPI002E7749BF|nr:hypothetical protein [Ruminococcus sp.]MEE1262054.1 hypothetical protein [Ruminococcus sp.]
MENQKTDKLEKLIEKIKKVTEQINKENAAIIQAKQKLKTLQAQKKKLQKQIQNEEYAQLRDVLADYGIRSIEDFERFIDKTENPQAQ